MGGTVTDIVYTLDSRHPFDVTLEITLGGGMVNTGKVMKEVSVGDNVVLLYDDMVLGSAPILGIEKRPKAGQEIAHGRVRPLSPEQRMVLRTMAGRGKVNARGGAYLR